MSRDVYVAGVGMHPFMRNAPSGRDMYFTAAMETMKDAGIKFQEVGALYNGYIGGEMMEGVTFAKDLGLTNVPIVHVENASATGSCAFREAVNAVKGGECDIAMAVGYDDMIKHTRKRAIMAMADKPKIEQTMSNDLPHMRRGQHCKCEMANGQVHRVEGVGITRTSGGH